MAGGSLLRKQESSQFTHTYEVWQGDRSPKFPLQQSMGFVKARQRLHSMVV